MRRAATLAVLLALAPCVVGCGWSNSVRAERTETHHLAHVPGAALKVDTRNGRVEIFAAPKQDEVTVEVKLVARAGTQEQADLRVLDCSVDVSRDENNRLVVAPVFPEPVHGGDGASFTIHLPDAHGVHVDTGNGSVYVAGMSGELIVDTANGRVEVEDHTGFARLNTSNGSIRVYHHEGEVEADTSNGSIKLFEVDGVVDANTSNGSIDVMLARRQSGPVDLKASNGSVSVRVGPEFAGTVGFGTSNGRVTVRDPYGRITNSSLKKHSGTITVGPGGEVESTRSRIGTSNGSIRFTISGG